MLRLAFLAALALADSPSCQPAKAKEPLAGMEPAPALSGNWIGSLREDPVFLHVYPLKNGELDLVLVGGDDKTAAVLHYQARASGGKYLSLRAKTFADPLTSDFQLSPSWTFAKYEIGKDGTLSLYWLSEEGLAKRPLQKAIADPKAWTAFEPKFQKLRLP